MAKTKKAMRERYQRSDAWNERVELPDDGHYALMRRPTARELINIKSEIEEVTEDESALLMLKLMLVSIHDGHLTLRGNEIDVDLLPADVFEALMPKAGEMLAGEEADPPGEGLQPQPES